MFHGTALEQLMRLVEAIGVDPSQPAAAHKTNGGTAHHCGGDTDTIQIVLDRHDIDYYVREKPGLRIYELRQCPFNPVHRRSGFLVNTKTGQTGFHCHHNSCSDFKYRHAVAFNKVTAREAEFTSSRVATLVDLIRKKLPPWHKEHR